MLTSKSHTFYYPDRFQISLLILREFKEIINFYSSWNYQKIYGFLIISGGIELVYLNLLHIRSKIWRSPLIQEVTTRSITQLKQP